MPFPRRVGSSSRQPERAETGEQAVCPRFKTALSWLSMNRFIKFGQMAHQALQQCNEV
jgi:hypothetical protein